MSQSILVFAGSTRAESLNKKLARAAADLIEAQGGKATFVDLKDYAMPLYDGDFEANEPYPPAAAKLKKLMLEHDGFLLACPEYNSSITAVLKNTIDWLSRSEEGSGDLSAFMGNVAGICSASPGALGGLRGLVHVRAILGNIGVHVIPNQFALGGAMNAFDEQGQIIDDGKREQMSQLIKQLLQSCEALRRSA